MEETIGYEALFSSEEWESLDIVDWEPDGGGDVKHTVTVVAVHDGYELGCDQGDFFDHVSDVRCAANLKRLHEEFEAVVVDRTRLER